MALWGVDLGGTKIEGVVLKSLEDPEVLIRKRIDTEADHGYKHILNRIKELIAAIAEELGEHPATIGIGTPGASDPITGLLKNSNTTCLNGQPFKADLEKLLGFQLQLQTTQTALHLRKP